MTTLNILIFLVITLYAFISWLLFARISMARIEKELNAKGIEPSTWDGIGLRAVWYAWAILFHGTRFHQKNDILFMGGDLSKYFKTKDRILSAMLISSATLLMVSGIFFHFYGS
ncbi:MAG: hypothetical protein MI864_06720 [Pseudomonadales bacterium]|nr:hypothetical protein [Pseudomonadales bacterium]